MPRPTNRPTSRGYTLSQNTPRPNAGTITAWVLLERAPALSSLAPGASLSGSSAAAVQSAAATIQASQRALQASLTSLGNIQVTGSLRFTENALIVRMDASKIAAIEALPGVLAVVPDQVGTLDNAHSVPFIGAVQAWEAAGGYTGSGIRIGIIDSGIDYTHANFGGSGDTSHYTGNDSTDITDFNFDGSKVVTGFDFVGDGWTAGAPLQGSGGTPLGTSWVFTAGDDDPLDCNGHGSHVAGTAAGYGVDGAGVTFAGPWDSSVPFNSMTIGPGVAPEASIYSMKIGDCTPSVSFAAASLALDFAIDPNGDGNPADHLDVINNSYGGAYGTPQEILTQQFDLTAQAGVIIVASAGNDGDTYFVNGDPGTSEWTISTAASVNDTVYAGLEVTTGDASFPSYPTVIAANPSQGGALGSFGPYSLRMVGGTGNSQGCNVADYAAFDGEAGLIVWTAAASGCGSGTRMTNAVNAGNVAGLVVVSANPVDFPFINLACTYNGGASSIPCVSVSNDDGQLLAANPGAFTVRFDDSLQAALSTTIADTLAGFSSRGPRMDGGTGEVVLKPDIAAPGSAIVSTGAGTGNQAVTESGTSMASPHMTGVAALMRQVHPSWTVPEIKALLMNTATHDLWTQPNFSGDNYGVSRIGAGRVDVVNALNSNVIAYHTAHPERVSVSFGLVEVVDSVSIPQTVTVQNFGGSPETYDVTFQQMNDTPGVQFSVSPAQITVPAGGTTTVTVTLTANKASMANANVPDPTTPTTQSGAFGPLPRERIMEEGGYVVLTSTGAASDLRVPVHAAPRPAADMHADAPVLISDDDIGFAALHLSGNGVNTGSNYPNDIISEVTAMELVGEDPVTQPTELGGGDIQYVGVTSDYLSALALCSGDTNCAINNTTIYIGISVYGQWSTFMGFESWFDIGFDSDEDNAYDATVFNFETGYLINADYTDTILSWFTNGPSWITDGGNPLGAYFINDIPPSSLETYVFNNNVIVFPVGAADIGLADGNTDFQFDVLALSSFFFADYLPSDPPYWFTYDVANPTYYFNDANGLAGGPYLGIPIWDDVPTGTRSRSTSMSPA
ncbi:MAG: S8 family serine peptidase [Anaerolineae bacterium]